MKKYVRQLLTDLHGAKNRKPEKPNVRLLYPDHPALDFGLDYLVEWEMSPEIPMQEFFGIQAMQFPPIDKLSKHQLKKLVEAILDLWLEFSMYADFPDGLPMEIKYTVLVKQWGKPFQYVSEGMMDFMFCDLNIQECPFGEKFCGCKEFEDEDMNEGWKLN